MKYILSLVLFLLLVTSVNALTINEVMPRGDEWVELYNQEGYIDLGKWNISDNYSTDQITCYNIPNCNLTTNATYFLIIGRSTNISRISNASITYFYVDDSAIGNGLNDNGDVVFISNSSSSDNFSYSSSSFNNSWSYNGTWNLCIPTPGYKNSCSQETSTHEENLSLHNSSDMNNTNTTNSIENNTVFYNNSDCDFYPEITSTQVYETNYIDYKIIAKNKLCSVDRDFSFLYWIEDLNGKIVKDVVNTSSSIDCSKTFSRSWTAPEEGLQAYIIKVNMSVVCDTNISNNYIEKIIVIKGRKEVKETRSFIEVEEFNKNISWNSNIVIPLNIYKGDTSKYTIRLYTKENIANDIKIHTREKFSNISLEVFLTPKDPCKNNLIDGNYTLIIEGLDKKLEIPFSIKEANCTNNIIKNKLQIFEAPEIVYIGDPFNSTLTINNSENYSLNITAYSYVYDGSKLLSKGFSNKWLKTLDANKKIFEITANSTKIITFENKIDDAEEGIYKIKVRINKNSKEDDIISEIQLVKRNFTNITIESSNTTKNKITGKVIDNGKGVKEKNILDSLKDWLSSIFKVKKDADNWL
ncbi:MAG: hypothetical protein HY831_00030 [Candidatus Aenigmarchaeota archaeon]|nr:hypothetical protein [Candidatus Aenigmarchaeota archaeon]